MRAGVTVGLVLWTAAIAEDARSDPTAEQAAVRQAQGSAEQLAERELEQLGEGYAARVEAERKIVYVAALDDAHFAETAALLAAFDDAFARTLGGRARPWYVTVVLPTATDYRRLLPPELDRDDVTGFYDHAARRLVALDRGRVLLHEFTHALHLADAGEQPHPTWLREGLATLFERSRVTRDGLAPYVDGRVVEVQRAIRENGLIRLQRLIGLDDKAFMRRAALAYAESRYLMLYLYGRGKLAAFYSRYKEGFDADPSGAEALAETLGEGLPRIEEKWRAWVAELRPAENEARTMQARLGLQVRNHSQGVLVAGVVPGSAAEKAGRIRAGDVIVRFNGRGIRTPGEFVGAVRAARALQTVEVSLLRHGRPTTVRQPLGAPGD